ncbi:MAG: phosphotransferase [Sphingomonadaceae bacterium]|nr:phosphotransferase [Sphingomonadaceae bacterium]
MAVVSNEQVAALVERNMPGLRVTGVRRQQRWRPAWFVDAERDGLDTKLMIRGERVDTVAFPLRHEITFHKILQDHGIPVPKIYGWIDEIEAAICEQVPGTTDLSMLDAVSRDRVVDEYLQTLVNVHKLPIEPFADAGILRADRPEESGTVGHFKVMEARWRAKKIAPHPFLEFTLGWLHRHPPRSRGRECPIVWDSGQFHQQQGRITAILDLEFGHIGDPMLDITVWRMRDTLLGFGDMNKIYARYEELSGEPIDVEAIKLHHFAGTIGNEMMFGPAVLDPVAETDLMNNMQWDSETNLHATEALAEYLEIELPTIEIPAPKRTRYDNSYRHLVESLKRMDADEPFLRHDIRLAFRTARHLARANGLGDAIAEADLDDLHQLLGHRPSTWWEGDAELERFVLTDKDTGHHDEALIRLFHKRNLRVHALLGPSGSKMIAHHPTQRFDGRESINTATF